MPAEPTLLPPTEVRALEAARQVLRADSLVALGEGVCALLVEQGAEAAWLLRGSLAAPELVAGSPVTGLPPGPSGSPDSAAGLHWVPLPGAPGDLILVVADPTSALTADHLTDLAADAARAAARLHAPPVHRAAEEDRSVRALFHALPGAMAVTCVTRGPDGEPQDLVFEHANPAWERLTTLSADRLVGLSLGALLDVTDRLPDVRRVLESGQPTTYEAFALSLGRQVMVTLLPLGRDRLGVVVEDITDRKLPELRTAEREALAGQLAETSTTLPGAFFTVHVSPAGNRAVSFATPAIEDLLGVPRAVLARGLGTLVGRVHPEDLALLGDTVKTAAQTLATAYFLVCYEHPTKGRRWLEARARPRPATDQGSVWHGYVVDVTDQHRVLEDLRRSEQRYRSLVENLEAMVFHLDALGRFTFVSGGISRYGYDPEEFLGRHFDSFVHPGDRALARECLAQAVGSAGEPAELRLANPQGGTFYFGVSLRPLWDGSRFLGVVGVAVDQTQRRESEQRVRQAQKLEALGRLAGGVAHDFNNILSVIVSCADLALDAVRPFDPLEGDLQDIRHAAGRAAALTRQLLAFSRRDTVQVQDLSLADVMTSLRPMLARLIGEHIHVQLQLAPDLWRIRADQAQLEQVVMNLALNSRDAMGTGGVLTVSARNASFGVEDPRRPARMEPGDYVGLTVADTGVGMDPTVLRQIFEPFFTTKPEGQGTGLGLATVQAAVEQIGGGLAVDSTPGKGTRFVVYLPRSTDATTGAGANPAPTADANGERVLVVEDDATLRRLVRRLLDEAGYRAECVASPEEALSLAEAQPWDLLLTDLVLPGMNGAELANRFRSRRPDARVLYCTGYEGETLARCGLSTSLSPLLAKPFDSRELLRSVRLALDTPAH